MHSRFTEANKKDATTFTMYCELWISQCSWQKIVMVISYGVSWAWILLG